MSEIKTLNGYALADTKAREDITSLSEEIANKGNPTKAQVSEAVDAYLSKNPVQSTPVDPTLTQSGAAADAKATGMLKEALMYEVSENLFNPDAAEKNKQLYGSGNTVDATDKSITEYIPVMAGEKLFFYNIVNNEFMQYKVRILVAFDADKDAIEYQTSKNTYTATQDGYVRAEYANNYEDVFVVAKTEQTAYVPYFTPHYSVDVSQFANIINDVTGREVSAKNSVKPHKKYAPIALPAIENPFGLAVFSDGLGAFTTDYAEYMLDDSPCIYASPNGSENATGLSMAEPTTLERALLTADTGYTVRLASGLYFVEGAIRINRQINLIGDSGATLVLDGTLVEPTIDATSGLKMFASAACSRLISADNIDLEYSAAGSLSECQGTAGTWYSDGGQVYVNSPGRRFIALDESTSELVIQQITADDIHMTIKGITIIGGKNNVRITAYVTDAVALAGHWPTVKFENCRFLYAFGCALSTVVCDVLLYKCNAMYFLEDAYQYMGGSGVKTRFVEIECSASCGDGSSASQNASTAHAGCVGIRINGLYDRTHGPVVADTGSGTMSVNINCASDHGIGEGRKMGFTFDDAAVGYCIGCSADGQDKALYVAATSTAYVRDNAFVFTPANNIIEY